MGKRVNPRAMQLKTDCFGHRLIVNLHTLATSFATVRELAYGARGQRLHLLTVGVKIIQLWTPIRTAPEDLRFSTP